MPGTALGRRKVFYPYFLTDHDDCDEDVSSEMPIDNYRQYSPLSHCLIYSRDTVSIKGMKE